MEREGRSPPATASPLKRMDRRRILRSPWFWIVLGLLVVLVVPPLFRGNGGFEEVPTSTALAQIESGNYSTVVVNDREQTVDITLNSQVDGHDKITSAYPSGLAERVGTLLDQRDQEFETKISQQNIFVSLLISLVPILLIVFLLFFIMNSVQGGGSRVMNFGKSKAKLVSKDTPKTTFADVAGADEAIQELRRDQGVPGESGEVPGHRRQDPQGRPAVRAARHRQDAARPRGGRRGRGAVLLDLRLGLRGDVRRRRRLPGARPVRAGEGQRAGDHLRGRDRRGRPAPRRRPRRRPRRARADPQPAARRDGRLRRQGRRDPHRRDQPAGHPRPGPAAPGPLRPADRGRPARPARPHGDPRRARQGQAARPGHRPRRHRPAHPRLHRCRPGQRDQRGGAADRPAGRPVHHDGVAGGGDRPRHRGPGAARPGR